MVKFDLKIETFNVSLQMTVWQLLVFLFKLKLQK